MPISICLSSLFIYLFLKKILFIHDRERKREAETQAEGEAGSMPEARRGTRSRDSRMTPWAEGKCSTAEPPRHPNGQLLRRY